MKLSANLIRKAEHSPFYLRVLNLFIGKIVPFNRPHHLKITSLTSDSVTALLPFKRTNQNHLRGMHACALATLCEFTCGFQLLRMLGFQEFRLILKELKMDYYYQAKTEATATFTLGKMDINNLILHKLSKQDALFTTFIVKAYDATFNPICTAHITWQIKPWKNVRTQTVS